VAPESRTNAKRGQRKVGWLPKSKHPATLPSAQEGDA
jgi:hypothetical protein